MPSKWEFKEKQKVFIPGSDFFISLFFFVIILIILYCFYTGIIRIEDFFCIIKNSGVLGVVILFFSALLANAALFLPTPLYLLVAVIGAGELLGLGIFSPLLVGVVAATAGAIGEFSGYIVGYLGITTFKNMKKSEVYQLEVLRKKLDESGLWLIVIFSFLPLPFDVIGIVAGLARYSKLKFFLGCWLGKVPKYVLISYLGYFGVSFLLSLFGVSQEALLVSCAKAAAGLS